MDVQYYHNNEEFERYTVALMLPDKEDLLDLTEPFYRKDLPINLGIAKLHPNDQYSKKIGREVSSKKLIQYYAKIVETFHERDIIRIKLEVHGKNLPFKYLLLQVHKISDRVYFLGVEEELPF